MGKEHITFVLQYAPTKMMPLSPVLIPTVKIQYDTVSLVETLMALGASVPTSPYTAPKWNSVSVQWQGTGEECTLLRDTVWPQDTAVPPLTLRRGTEEMEGGALSLYQLVSMRIACLETSGAGEYMSSAQPEPQALFSNSNQHLLLITPLILREQSNRAEGIFCIGSSSTTSRIPAQVTAPDRNTGIHKSWHTYLPHEL